MRKQISVKAAYERVMQRAADCMVALSPDRKQFRGIYVLWDADTDDSLSFYEGAETVAVQKALDALRAELQEKYKYEHADCDGEDSAIPCPHCAHLRHQCDELRVRVVGDNCIEEM